MVNDPPASLDIFLMGPFAVLDQQGRTFTPKSQKSKAVVAMLALAPRGSRSRVWLRDKLWSDRGEDQASASLRQALLDIRKNFGPVYKDILISDNYSVTLDLSRVRVDAIDLVEQAEGGQAEASSGPAKLAGDFLEGFDICDPEFENWLTLERQIWVRRFERRALESEQPDEPDVASVDHGVLPAAEFGPTADADIATPDPSPVTLRKAPGSWAIGLLDTPMTQGYTKLLSDKLMRNLQDMGRVPTMRVSHDFLAAGRMMGAGHVEIPLLVRVIEIPQGENVRLAIELVSTEDGVTSWSSSQVFSPHSFAQAAVPDLNGLVSQTVIQIGRQLQAAATTQDMASAGLLIECIYQIFGLSVDQLSSAVDKLNRLLKHQPNAQTYAWMAFSKSFQVGQRFSPDAAALISEAQYYATRALEEDEFDPLVLSLAAHIHSYLFSEFDLAASLFERALKLDPEQTIGWDLYATMHAYTGHNGKALAMASWGQHLGANTPISYYFDTTKCIAATLAGDHKSAIEAGEKALVQRPKFNSILRYLVSSHAHLGNAQMVESLRQRLMDVEPDFSTEVLRGSGYPGLGTEGGQHFLLGLRKAGFGGR
ncbi:SARP family transcriptional regulator [Ruegeria sp. HKCCD8929]|uniref:SARP family transcriptional regulator n=1 Tax=Ruegeria sp. HKCCD8929 TaxID=2683006 RepID=UPI0014893B2E|nr:SARP family transcriptional regulator [Ruegeria sp. HKCCD8929]